MLPVCNGSLAWHVLKHTVQESVALLKGIADLAAPGVETQVDRVQAY